MRKLLFYKNISHTNNRCEKVTEAPNDDDESRFLFESNKITLV